MSLQKSIAVALLSTTSAFASAQMIDVEFTNLTQGIYFTPILAVAHTDENHLFQVGQAASSELQAMAEGGSLDGLVTVANSISASIQQNPAEGLLGPAMSVSINDWDTGSMDQLSLVAMLLPTNDGFVGIDSWTIPSEAGTYMVYLNAYDAGTEANDEIINGGGESGVPGIPADPTMMGGTGGAGVTSTSPNTMIHIHPGNVGDSDAEGGNSDLNNRVHRWLNPVAKLVITVK